MIKNSLKKKGIDKIDLHLPYLCSELQGRPSDEICDLNDVNVMI